MKLKSGPTNVLELRIAGYQFPGMATAQFDSNWLTVEGQVIHSRGEWRFQDPCLLTYEAAGLADWLEAVGQGRPADADQEFVEPNLRFTRHVVAGSHVVRVYFELESRPTWAPSNLARTEDLWLDFPVSEPMFTRAAESLRKQLGQHPQRTPR